MAELVVGVDLGTTALKAGLFDLDGHMRGLAQAEYKIQRPERDQAEQDPAAWLAALADVLGTLKRQTGVQAVAAIGVCGQVNTHVFVDEHTQPLRPAIVWQDQRCGALAGEMNQMLATAAPAKSERFVFAASSLVCRAEWLRREQPELWHQTRYVLSPKDFVTSHLCQTRTTTTDPISPFDLVDGAGAYDEDVLALVDGLAERLPLIEPFDAPIGVVTVGDMPLIGDAIVVIGTMDAWGNLYGSGVVEHGQAMEIAGTSEILGLLSRERRPTAGVVTFLPVDGLYLHAGPTQAGGASLAWFADLVGLSTGEIVETAAQAPAGSAGLIFLPHLLGERAPLWDSDVRGAFIGLSTDHSVAHLCRAVLEGVAYSARHLLEELENAAGVAPLVINASGGGAQSDLWCQIKADVFERPLARLRVRHSGCLGAALMAAAGAGLVGDLKDAAREAVQVEREFAPNAEHTPYAALYALYRELYLALKPTHAALADLRRQTSAVPTT